MVRGVFVNGYANLAIPRDFKVISKTKKSIVDINTIFFGGLTFVSLAVFFFFGRFRASAKQRDREDKINWTKNKFGFYKYFLMGMAGILGIAMVIKLFF